MIRSRLSFPKLYKIVKKYPRKITPNSSKRGRPRKYGDDLILTLWLYQTLWQTSYREVLEEAREFNFPTSSLSTYNYRVSKLSPKDLKKLLARIGKILAL